VDQLLRHGASLCGNPGSRLRASHGCRSLYDTFAGQGPGSGNHGKGVHIMVVTTVYGLPPLKGVLFDFGGVLSREGFRGGLYAIARKNGMDPEPFFLLASDVIYDTGYITGRATEAEYWEALRRATGIRGTDADLTSSCGP
jgi:hypothetical protein